MDNNLFYIGPPSIRRTLNELPPNYGQLWKAGSFPGKYHNVVMRFKAYKTHCCLGYVCVGNIGLNVKQFKSLCLTNKVTYTGGVGIPINKHPFTLPVYNLRYVHHNDIKHIPPITLRRVDLEKYLHKKVITLLGYEYEVEGHADIPSLIIALPERTYERKLIKEYQNLIQDKNV